MDCYLEKYQYTWKNAFFWGNFKNHVIQIFNKDLSKKVRAFHSLIAAIEFLPVASQIISVVEKRWAHKDYNKKFNHRIDDLLRSSYASFDRTQYLPARPTFYDVNDDDSSDDDVYFARNTQPGSFRPFNFSASAYSWSARQSETFPEMKQTGATRSAASQVSPITPTPSSIVQSTPVQRTQSNSEKLPELDVVDKPKDPYKTAHSLLNFLLEEDDQSKNYIVIREHISKKNLSWTGFLKQLDPKKFFQLFEIAINQNDSDELRSFLSCTNRATLLNYFLDAANEDSVILEIEGKELTFNRNFLALFFPYFQTMFNGKFREATTPKVVLDGIKYNIFLGVLDQVLFNARFSTMYRNLKDYITTFKFLQVSTSTFKEWADQFFESRYAPLQIPLYSNAFLADDFANEAMEKKVKRILSQPFDQYNSLEHFLPFVPKLYPEIKTWIKTNLDIIPISVLENFFAKTTSIIPVSAIRKKLLEILSKETAQPGLLFNWNSLTGHSQSANFLVAMAPFVPDLHKTIGDFLGRHTDSLSDFASLESCKVIFRSLIQTRLEIISTERNFFLGETINNLTKYLPHLKKLSLKEANVFFCERVLPLATNLKLLEITINDPNVIQHLHQLPNLKTLHVKLGENITDEDLQELAKLKQIKKLDLSACQKITDEGFRHLASLKKLKVLILHSNGTTFNGLSKECLSYLTNCLKLKKLVIGGHKVKDVTIAHIAENFPKLRKLVIESCPNVTAKGLQCLQNLKKLEDLQIIECAQIHNEAQIFPEEDEEPLEVNRPSKST